MTHGRVSETEIPDDLFECAVLSGNTSVGLTTEGGSEAEYRSARRRHLQDPACRRLLPDFARLSSDAASGKSELSSVAELCENLGDAGPSGGAALAGVAVCDAVGELGCGVGSHRNGAMSGRPGGSVPGPACGAGPPGSMRCNRPARRALTRHRRGQAADGRLRCAGRARGPVVRADAGEEAAMPMTIALARTMARAAFRHRVRGGRHSSGAFGRCPSASARIAAMIRAKPARARGTDPRARSQAWTRPGSTQARASPPAARMRAA